MLCPKDTLLNFVYFFTAGLLIGSALTYGWYRDRAINKCFELLNEGSQKWSEEY